jgi:hypothetical protein
MIANEMLEKEEGATVRKTCSCQKLRGKIVPENYQALDSFAAVASRGICPARPTLEYHLPYSELKIEISAMMLMDRECPKSDALY